ncbi:hypothetical protein J7E97_35175 [Streptomyces sp. ISL-66]|uniref:hypothetical protein n=1 Tax=Streptomyces sp. ISL-66 TaxID=2819186 RepID=UPI001BE770DD|nr:hypothetical protein [Streptomyces sp. ISL-66]MBT2472953.1 hypothetical protein [Streptomyces sp. ISL-66]
MAKNKKQSRDQQKSSSPGGAEQSKGSSMTDQAEQRISHATPADMARKGREKRFGHN